MRQWFPFTDYDFFAHIFSGTILVTGTDYAFNSGSVLNKSTWTPAQAILAIALVYVVGIVVAQLSSIVIERFFSRTILYPSTLQQLGVRKSRWREKLVRAPFAQRECQPLSEVENAAAPLRECLDDSAAKLKCDALFQSAFTKAIKEESIRQRLTTFQNQYGFSRNLSFVFLILAICFIFSSIGMHFTLALSALFLSVFMLGRFEKFYAAYSKEVFRVLD